MGFSASHRAAADTFNHPFDEDNLDVHNGHQELNRFNTEGATSPHTGTAAPDGATPNHPNASPPRTPATTPRPAAGRIIVIAKEYAS